MEKFKASGNFARPPSSPVGFAEASYDIFRQFCNSSTLHGTYFWAEAKSGLGKLVWVIVVAIGIIMSAFIINKSFSAWKKNPVVTSVAQLPIEAVPFPAITICPIGNTRFNYAEMVITSRGLGSESLASSALAHLVVTLISELDPLSDHCIVDSVCQANTDIECPLRRDFEQFRENREDHVEKVVKMVVPDIDTSTIRMSSFRSLPTSCPDQARHYLFLLALSDVFNNFNVSSIPHGAIIRMLYSNLYPEEKPQFYKTYIPRDRFPELYGSKLGLTGEFGDVPLPELVEELTKKEPIDEDDDEGGGQADSDSPWKVSEAVKQLRMSTELLREMRTSLHPPHKFVESDRGSREKVPNAAFPYCYYEDKDEEGVKQDPFKARFCDSFQTTFNEMGLCYTFNNPNLGFDPDLTEDAIKVRNVKGCGRKKGLSIIIDRHKLWTQPLLRSSPDKHFVVYITVPGVVTHKVPFVVDASYFGEHHFFVHGIHFITASEAFVQWNEKNLVCYGHNTKNLTYFASYTQDNCLLECRYKKIMDRCGCAPWYLNQSSHHICGREGNACFKSAFDNYQEDLADLTECDCRSDCGGIHVFSSMSRYSFNDETATQPTLWWNPKKEKGRLAEYLLDKDHTLVDEFSKNMARLALNLSSDLELANRRFRDDVTIVNVFFDTPIITQVKLEMKVTIFDQISAIGGTLGLFTGVSLISFVEITYWLLRLVSAATFSAFFGASINRGGVGSANNNNNKPRQGIFSRSSTVDIINRDNNSMSVGDKSVDLPPLYQNYANPQFNAYRR